MQLFRKFYDVASPETPSIATIMAKSGALNRPENQGAIPQVSTEKKEETPQPTANTPAATADQPPKAATEVSESPKPAVEVKTEPLKKEEPVKIPSWQEVLKQQQPDIILKELGFDDETAAYLKGRKGIEKKMLNLLSHWENNGDVNRYLQEANADYSKMSAENVMRLQLQREYPKANEKQLEVLFKKEVLEAYKLIPDAYSAEEADEGRLLLEAKADKYRDELVKQQQDFLMPKAPEKKDEFAESIEKDKKLFESFKNTISGNPRVKSLLKESIFDIGEGDEIYKHPLTNVQEDLESITNLMATFIATGQLTEKDLEKVTDEYLEEQLLKAEFNRNPRNFIKKIADHYKTIGGRQIIAPIENAKEPGSAAAKGETPPTTAAGAMAKSGRIVSGGS